MKSLKKMMKNVPTAPLLLVILVLTTALVYSACLHKRKQTTSQVVPTDPKYQTTPAATEQKAEEYHSIEESREILLDSSKWKKFMSKELNLELEVPENSRIEEVSNRLVITVEPFDSPMYTPTSFSFQPNPTIFQLTSGLQPTMLILKI